MYDVFHISFGSVSNLIVNLKINMQFVFFLSLSLSFSLFSCFLPSILLKKIQVRTSTCIYIRIINVSKLSLSSEMGTFLLTNLLHLFYFHLQYMLFIKCTYSNTVNTDTYFLIINHIL